MFNEPTEKKRLITSVLCDVVLKSSFEVLFLVSILFIVLSFVISCATPTQSQKRCTQ